MTTPPRTLLILQPPDGSGWLICVGRSPAEVPIYGKRPVEVAMSVRELLKHIEQWANISRPNEDNIVNITLRMPIYLRDRLAVHAKTAGITLNAWIAQQLEDKDAAV